MPRVQIDAETARYLEAMEVFEATATVANTGTGARREGDEFEGLVAAMWDAFTELCRGAGASASAPARHSSRTYTALRVGTRSLYLPSTRQRARQSVDPTMSRWLDINFQVSDLVASFPSEAEAIARYAPRAGPFAGDAYPRIYHGLTTGFDDTIILVDDGVLREKILLEYKTAKSSRGRQIDGNAHERLSFQVMQYLEVATRYTRCSLVVSANGAFVRYRNKYHVNFHIQADRLANFAWFAMEHACTVSEYRRFLEGLIDWLFDGQDRARRRRF